MKKVKLTMLAAVVACLMGAASFQTTIGTRTKGLTNQTERASLYASYYLTGTGQGVLRVAKRTLGSQGNWDYFYIKTGLQPGGQVLQIYGKGGIPRFRNDFEEEWLFEIKQNGNLYRKIQKPVTDPW